MANTPKAAASRPCLVKLRKVAAALDVSIDSVDRYVRAGKIPVYRLPGGQRRIAQDDLDRLIREWRTDGR